MNIRKIPALIAEVRKLRAERPVPEQLLERVTKSTGAAFVVHEGGGFTYLDRAPVDRN